MIQWCDCWLVARILLRWLSFSIRIIQPSIASSLLATVALLVLLPCALMRMLCCGGSRVARRLVDHPTCCDDTMMRCIGLCYYSVEMYITSLLCCCWQQFCLFSFAIDHAMRIIVGGGSSRVAVFSLSIRACVAIRPFWPRRLIYIAKIFKKNSKMAGRRDYLTKLI